MELVLDKAIFLVAKVVKNDKVDKFAFDKLVNFNIIL